MIFEDKNGNLVDEEELDRLPPYEIEDRGFHLYDRQDNPFVINIGKKKQKLA